MARQQPIASIPAVYPPAQEPWCDLVALENSHQPDFQGYDWIGIYGWNGFGLHLLWETPVRGTVSHINTGIDRAGPFILFTQQFGTVTRQLRLRPIVTDGDRQEYRCTVETTRENSRTGIALREKR